MHIYTLLENRAHRLSHQHHFKWPRVTKCCVFYVVFNKTALHELKKSTLFIKNSVNLQLHTFHLQTNLLQPWWRNVQCTTAFLQLTHLIQLPGSLMSSFSTKSLIWLLLTVHTLFDHSVPYSWFYFYKPRINYVSCVLLILCKYLKRDKL